MNQSDYNNAMIAVEMANTAVAAADSKQARKHATEEAKKARDFQEYMYDRQLDDNIAWRTHQEQYNSPEAQMQRYRDAGINPMYAVTGNGGNTVTTPMTANVSMAAKADTPVKPSPRFDSSVIAQAALTKAQVKAVNAQANMYNAQANEADARAEGYTYENVSKSYEADVVNFLKNIYTDLDGRLKNVSFAQIEANIRADKRKYDHLFNGMSFNDAKDEFMHLREVREFARDLNQHQRDKFESELSQAKSAAKLFEVSARWAIPNQWINAGSQVLGAAASVFGAAKGTSFMPTHSRSYSESYGDHTSRHFNY